MNEPADPVSGGSRRSRHSKRTRYLLIVPLLVLGVLAAAAAALPTVLSTDWGRETAVNWVNRSVPGKVDAEDISLSWLGGQSVQGLAIHDPAGQPVLKLASFTTDLSLLDALRRSLSLGQTVIQSLEADLVFDADGTSNLDAALGRTPTRGDGGQGTLVVPVTGNMALIDSRIAISAPGIDPVLLDNLSGALEMTGTEAPVRLSFGGRSRQRELTGSITVNGRISNLFPSGRLDPTEARAEVQAAVEDLPVDALDQLLGLRGVLSSALGDRTSVSIDANGDASRQNLAIDARAPVGNLTLSGVIADGRFSLSQPAGAQLALTPELVDAVSRAVYGEHGGVRLAAPVPVHLTVEQLELPVTAFNLSDIALRAGLEARGSIRLSGLQGVGEAAVNDLHIVVDSPGLGDRARISLNGKPVTQGQTGSLTLSVDVRELFDNAGNLQPAEATVQAQSRVSGIPTTLVDTVLKQDGLLLEAAGPTLGMDLDARTGEAGRVDVSLNIDSPRLKAGPVRLVVDDQVALSETAPIRLDLTPALWRRLAGEGAALSLGEPSAVTLEIGAFRMPLPAENTPFLQPGRTTVRAALAAEPLSFRDAAGGSPTRIEDLMLTIEGDTLADIALDVGASVIRSDGLLHALDASPMRLSLDARTGIKPDASVKAVTSTLDLDSAGLKTTFKTTVEEGFTRLSLVEPAVFEATVTPALLASTRSDATPAATLREPAGLRVTLERLIVPLAPFDYAGVSATGDLQLDTLAVQSVGGTVSNIGATEATFRFEGGGGGQAELDLDSRIRAVEGESGELSLALTAANLLNSEGAISGDALSLTLNGRLQQLPSGLVDQLLDTDGLVAATLGHTANLSIDTQLDKLRGPLSLSLDAANTRADIKARIGEQGLTLTEPLAAQLEPTPEFGQKVLAKVHPIFETTQRAEQPVRLQIPAEGVRIPIQDFDFSRVVVPGMALDFGRVVLKSGWLLRGIVGLGQRFGKMENVQREEWVAWFTPAVLKVENGQIIYTRRLDLLLDQRLHLATWGRADVVNDRSDLTLAFMPDTMERVFGITVAANDALHVPIRGPLSGPGVDFKKAAADLARLRAQEEVAGENPLAGLLLGSVGGKVTGAGPVPPASVSPLPWADMLRERDAARQQDQVSEPQKDEQPAREEPPSTEEQVIKGLIDIFGKKKKDN